MSLSPIEPPRLPDAPAVYDGAYMAQVLRVLRLFFNRMTARRALEATRLNIEINTLPTEADVANLRTGDVYRDTTAGDVLKIKT